jgi:hypothetical protein
MSDACCYDSSCRFRCAPLRPFTTTCSGEGARELYRSFFLLVIFLQRLHLELYDSEVFAFELFECGLGHHQLQTKKSIVVDTKRYFDRREESFLAEDKSAVCVAIEHLGEPIWPVTPVLQGTYLKR